MSPPSTDPFAAATAAGIHRLAIPTPFAVGRVNAYLIEDELLLALPLVPRHEQCPEPLPRAFVEDDPAIDPADNPFAVLAALKRGPRPN